MFFVGKRALAPKKKREVIGNHADKVKVEKKIYNP